MPGPGPGQFYSVHLEGVRARKVTHVEPSRRTEPAVFCTERIKREIDRRGCIKDGWER